MKRLSCHLPLLMLMATLLLGAASCTHDEPRGIPHHGNHDNPTPIDTTQTSDTTGNHGSDTTSNQGGDSTTTVFTICIDAARDYGYMGETLQLTAVTSSPATVTWRSTRTAVAAVDGNGLVTFNNAVRDDSTLIIATASGVSDTIALTSLCWKVATWQDNAWTVPSYLAVHRGDTISMTIIDSHGNIIDDHGFNAASCQWTVSGQNAETVTTVVSTPSRENGWQYRLYISDSAPDGTIVTVIAQHGEAASSLKCTVTH